MASAWRSPVDTSDRSRFARWLRDLADLKLSGAYAIRDRRSGEVLYVGESHTGRLYPTLTRHFQRWKGLTAGTTYDRHRVEVKLEETDPRDASDLQEDWIARLAPADNRQSLPRADDGAGDPF